MAVLAKLQNKINEGLSLFRMSRTAKSVRRKGLSYLSPSKLLRLEHEAMRVKRENIAGDFCEFGLALGGSGIVLAKQLNGGRHFQGFDVFEMIPPPSSEKDGKGSFDRYDAIKSGRSAGLKGQTYYGYEKDLFNKVKNHFREFDLIAGAAVQLHQGLFEQTWPQVEPQISAIALAHIDCDWYDPVMFCLNCCKSKMPKGGAIVIDDYFAYQGARSATDEFVASNPDFVLQPAGKHVVLLRK